MSFMYNDFNYWGFLSTDSFSFDNLNTCFSIYEILEYSISLNFSTSKVWCICKEIYMCFFLAFEAHNFFQFILIQFICKLFSSALNMLVQGILYSLSIPIVDENDSLLDTYSRSDITALAKDKVYTHVRLDEMTIHQALQLGQDANTPFGFFNGQRCQIDIFNKKTAGSFFSFVFRFNHFETNEEMNLGWGWDSHPFDIPVQIIKKPMGHAPSAEVQSKGLYTSQIQEK
ncbi:hypothetical protein ACJX0J_010777 [Zea mays]